MAKFDIQDHLDPTDEITLETVKQRVVKGVVVLAGRTFILNVLSLLATGLLTYFLEPSQFGVFWIVSAIVNFLYYFGDIGLAAALIQKKEKIERHDLITTFTIQQLLVITIILIVFTASPLFSNIYSLSSEGKFLLYALSLSLFLASLKTIPSVLMERELQFGKLVIPQVLENLFYNLTAVFFAWRGFGIRSFTYAVLVRAFIGLVVTYILCPWKPGIGIKKESLKKLLTFGLPYQANTLLATLKDDGMTAILGGILGSSGIGFLGWAQKWGQAPLRFFMDHVIRVTFPAFSRMQDDKDNLKKAVERSIFFIAFLVFPSVVGLVILAPILIEIIPKYEKWQPALIPLFIIAAGTLLSSITTQLTNLLNSIGKIKITFKLMIMWTILTWLLVPVSAVKYGVNGVAIAYFLVTLSSVVAIVMVRKQVDFSLTQSVKAPLLATLVMGIFLWIIKNILPVSLSTSILLVGVGIVVYFFSTYAILKDSFKEDVIKVINLVFRK